MHNTKNNVVRCIPDHVIVRMNDKIEPPALDNNWEYPFVMPLIIPCNNDNSKITAACYYSDILMNEILKYLTNLPIISQRQESTIENNISSEDRKRTKENIIHSLDIRLRNYVR